MSNRDTLLKTADKIRTESFDIWVAEEGILRVDAFEGVEVDLEQTKKSFDIYSRLGFGPGKKKALQIMNGNKYFSMTKEAKDYVAQQGKLFFIAAALISDSVALRLMVNLYNSVYKHNVPFKMFATEEKALEWLRKFKE